MSPGSSKKQGYKTPSENAKYPQGLISSLYQLKSQIPNNFDLVSYGNEKTLAINHLKALKQDDVVVYNRGYFSYAMLYHHNESKIHAVFRLQKKSSKVINDFMLSDKTDLIVTILPPKSSKKRIKLKNPGATQKSCSDQAAKNKSSKTSFANISLTTPSAL